MSAEKRRPIYVEPNTYRAVKIFSPLEGKGIDQFVSGIVMEHLNREYGSEFVTGLLAEPDFRVAIRMLTEMQLARGVSPGETLLGAMAFENHVKDKRS